MWGDLHALLLVPPLDDAPSVFDRDDRDLLPGLRHGGKAMTSPLTFYPTYPGGRILLRLGRHDVGAIFPPWGEGQHRFPWVWRFWLGGATATKKGRAKTELAAKNALLAEARDWLQKAAVG